MPIQRQLAACVPFVAAAFALTGCPGTVNIVVPSAVGARSPVPRVAESSPVPRDPEGTPSPRDSASPAALGEPVPERTSKPAATLIPKPTPTLAPAGTDGLRGPDPALAARCSADLPAAKPVTLDDRFGAYRGLTAPYGWDKMANEAAVTNEIEKYLVEARTGDAARVNQWNCFNKFFPSLLTIFAGLRTEGNPTGAPIPKPTPTPLAVRTAKPTAAPTTVPLSALRPEPTATPSLPCGPFSAVLKPSLGTAAHGAYDGKSLPSGWAQTFPTEAAVTTAIGAAEGSPEWACFQRLFPVAAAIYMTRKP